MIPIYYKSSEGVIINLISEPYMMLTDTELLNSKWTPVTAGTNNPKIVALNQELQSPPFLIVVSGTSKSDMMNNLEHIEGVFDRDCFLGEMGRLYIGDFYRECFITSSTKEKVFETESTTVQYVATSNDGFWKNDKNFELSGQGMPTGEIAYTVTPTATPNGETLEWSANDDKTASIKWNSGRYGEQKSLVFDLGSENYIGRFRGIHIGGSTTPANCSVQTWDGESTVAETKSTSMDEAALPLPITIYNPYEFPFVYSTRLYWWTIGDDIFQVKATTVPTGVNVVLVGSNQATNYEAVEILTDQVDRRNELIDVSRFDSIRFYAFSREEVTGTMTVNFTEYARDWQEIDSFTSSPNQQTEIDVEDFTARYVRMYSSNYFGGTIEDDSLSFYSGEPVQERDLFGLGYSLDNVEVIQVSEGVLNYKLIDDRKSGTLLFDARSVILKEITSAPHSVNDGIIIISGENDGVWTKICDLESDSAIDWTYNDHYDKIKISFVANQQDHFVSATLFSIMAESDPVIYNESYAPSDAIIEIEGPRNNPQISIGGVEYGANIELAEGHRLQIDTIEHTVRDYSSEYAFSNVYSARSEGAFEKIERGENAVYWDGQQTVRIKLFQARSTPKWN